jgi:hypothetical protein
MPFEIVIGRYAAWCLHPVAAWRVVKGSGRALIVATYAGASFAVTLVTLLLL